MSRSAGLRVLLLLSSLALPACQRQEGLRVGSKSFTESVILGEVARHLLEEAGQPTEHRRQLGGSMLLFNALQNGDLDLYPEYTGTLRLELLSDQQLESDTALPAALAALQLKMTRPLGFNNTYILGMAADVAEQRGIRRISDLRDHPELQLAFSSEFMKRQDGWPELKTHYALPHEDVRGIDHDLAYRFLNRGEIQVTDLYSTDAEIREHGLFRLEDDLQYFPVYEAVYLYRADLERRAPRTLQELRRLEDQIKAPRMVGMNAEAKFDGRTESEVAASFLNDELGLNLKPPPRLALQEFLRYTWQHLFLVALSLAAAVVVALPLGILAAKCLPLRQPILAVVGVLQTIPSLALLALMVSLLSFPIGAAPALCALFLYSLLPIVRNTCSGLSQIPGPIHDSARALGLSPWARLRLIEMPLAAPTILAGIKTSAVINVGTATLGTLIGAGGYGEPIWTGLRLEDDRLILLGAGASAAMAMAFQGVFELAERRLVSRGLRL